MHMIPGNPLEPQIVGLVEHQPHTRAAICFDPCLIVGNFDVNQLLRSLISKKEFVATHMGNAFQIGHATHRNRPFQHPVGRQFDDLCRLVDHGKETVSPGMPGQPGCVSGDAGNRQGINADLIRLQSQTFPGIVSRADHQPIGGSFQIAGIPGKTRQNGQ